MQLRHRLSRLAVGGATALGLFVLTVPGAASAAKANAAVTEKGTITCRATGTITFKPPLSMSSAAKTTMTVSGALNTCKQSKRTKGITITGGKLSGKSSASMSCTGLERGLPKLAGMLTWKAKGGNVAPTTYTFSGGTPSFTKAPITFVYPQTGGRGVAKGSFATTNAKASLVLKQTEPQLIGKCGSTTGLKTLNFTKSSTFAAASAPRTAKGSITCHTTGTITFKPAISLGSAVKTTMTFSGTLNTCKTSKASKTVTVTTGILKGKSSGTESCTTLEQGLPKLTGSLTWNSKGGPVAATRYAFSGGTPNFAKAPISFTYPKKGGSGVAKGSYANNKAKASFVLRQTEQQLIGQCKSGLKTLNFTKSSTVTA